MPTSGIVPLPLASGSTVPKPTASQSRESSPITAVDERPRKKPSGTKENNKGEKEEKQREEPRAILDHESDEELFIDEHPNERFKENEGPRKEMQPMIGIWRATPMDGDA